MKTILVPTDFSENSDNALEFACMFNKPSKAKIILLHSYHIPIPTSDIPVVPPSESEIRNLALEKLEKVKDKFSVKYPELSFEPEAVLGMASDEIKNCAKRNNADLIIMGTHGASGLKEFVLGTNAASVIENAHCMVMTIPEGAVFKGMKSIVFAADYGQHNYDHMIKLIEVAKLFNSEINLLHISSGAMEETFEDLEIGRFKERIVRDTGYQNISYRLFEDKDAFHGMNSYLEQFKPDLLAISMHHRSFLQKIFSRSMTKRLAYHSHVPVMALHIPHL